MTALRSGFIFLALPGPSAVLLIVYIWPSNDWIMRAFLGFLLCCMLLAAVKPGRAQSASSFSRISFYRSMAGKDSKAVDLQLELLHAASLPDKQAWEGALLMKKAGLVSGAKKKLDLFKEGHRKLEAIIQKDSTNPEYRLLRLMIQEHAPKVLGYRNDIAGDRAFVQQHFDELPKAAQQAAKEYNRGAAADKTEKP